MRKFFLFILLIALLLFPTLAQAQSDVKFAELNIQLWPEYDHPDMLVMYSFVLASGSALPAEVEVRIPANANLNAVAKVEGDGLVNVPYDAPVKDGDSIILTIPIDDLSTYRVEYYAPIDKNGATRSYHLVWQSAYAVEALSMQFMQPPGSTNFTSTPALPDTTPTTGNIIYHDLSAGSQAAGATFDLTLSYEKENDDLTVSSMPVEVGGGTVPTPEETSSSSFSSDNALPLILVGAGILLIAGGLLYFFLAGRRESEPQARKRHAPSTATAGGNIYCHECGSRAGAGDKFCRSCGAKLRK